MTASGAASAALLQLPTYGVGAVPFRGAPFADCVRAVLSAASADGPEKGVAGHFANAYSIALARADEDYAALLRRPGAVVLTDGVPVAWVGRRGYPEVAGSWQRTGPGSGSGVRSMGLLHP